MPKMSTSRTIDAPEKSKLLRLIDEKAFGLLQDPTRRRMMFLLRDNELTVRELTSSLGLTAQDIYHHIKKLEDADLIRVAEEKRSGHLIQSYYTATADTFVYHCDEMVERSTQSFIDVLNGLNDMNMDVEVSVENAKKLAELHEQRLRLMSTAPVQNDICSSCGFSGYFMKFGPMNPLLLERTLSYQSMMKMNDQEFEESIRLTRQIRQFLLSIKVGKRRVRKSQ